MHSSELMPFVFDGRSVRVMEDEEGNPWFVAKDVALALGYDWSGITTIKHVPEEWRRVESVSTLRRGEQETWLLSEQGLYFFLGRSDKAAALPFQKWLAGEVLPALRKTGEYRTPRAPIAAPDVDTEEMEAVMLALPRRYRDKAMSYAVQMCRAGYKEEDVEARYLRFCYLLGMGDDTGPEAPPAPVQDWARETLESAPDTVGIQSIKLYRAYCEWHGRNRSGRPVSAVLFGRKMRKLFLWYRSNVYFYRVRWRRGSAGSCCVSMQADGGRSRG